MDSDYSNSIASRRRFLSSVAAAGTVSITGCTGTLPPLGQRVRFGQINIPSAGSPDYRKWIPAGSHLPGRYSDSPIHATRPERLPRGTLGRSLFVSPSDYLGTEFNSYQRTVNIGGVYVFEGAANRNVVAAALDGTRYELAGSYESYDLYDRNDRQRTVAVTDGVVLWARGEDRRQSLEVIIDTGAGRIARRHETDNEFAMITEAMGATDFDTIGGLDLGLEATSDAHLTGMSHTYQGTTGYVRAQYLFDTVDAVPEPRRLKRELRANETAARADAADVRTDGRRAVVDLRSDESDDCEGFRTPHITWGVSFDSNTNVVTLHHEAGDSVAADKLNVSLHDESGSNRGVPAPDGRQFDDIYSTVDPGDSLVVAVEASTVSVSVSFRPSEYRSSRLLTYDLS